MVSRSLLPDRPLRRRGPYAALASLLGGASLVVAGHVVPPPAVPVPEQIVREPVLSLPPPVPAFLGPPEAVIPSAVAQGPVSPPVAKVPERRVRRGGLGPMSPIRGPLNAEVTLAGPVRGPRWKLNPLPAVGPAAQQAPRLLGASPAPPPAGPPGSELSSELPNPKVLALSRLANPVPQVRAVVPRAEAAAAKSAPISLRLQVKRSRRGFRAGQVIPVQLSASAACYQALIRVDASGSATTLFRSGRPVKNAAVALKAESDGPVYLLAVGSVHPLGGSALAAALRSAGTGFAAAPAAVGGTAAGSAWAVALTEASGFAGGGPKEWERHEWDSATLSLNVQPATRVAQRPRPAARPAEPQSAEKSAVPAPADPENSPPPGMPQPEDSSRPASSGPPGGASELPGD